MRCWPGLRVGVIIWGLLGISWPTVAEADPITDKIEKERKALDQLKGQIEETRKQADEAGKKRESLLQGIQTLDERVVHFRQAHQEISRKLRKKDQEIEAINMQLSGLRVSVRERQDAILARLRVQYMEGRFGYWKTLLASDSYGDFQRRLQYLSAVSERDYALMGTFRADMTRMEQAERQREEARVGMVSYKQTTEKQLAEMKSVKKEKKIYLAKITHEKESYEHALQELERSASRIDSLLRELEQRRRAAAARPPTGVIAPRGVKGALPWPADGSIVSFFGRQKHPTFNTYVQRRRLRGVPFTQSCPGPLSMQTG